MITPINKSSHKISFGKAVPTIKVIEMITACDLDKPNGIKLWIDSFDNVAKAMTNQKSTPSAELARQCSDVLTTKYPFLNKIILNYYKFIDSFPTSKDIDLWKEKQVELIGSETIDVPKFKPDMQKVYAEPNKAMYSKGFFDRMWDDLMKFVNGDEDI